MCFQTIRHLRSTDTGISNCESDRWLQLNFKLLIGYFSGDFPALTLKFFLTLTVTQSTVGSQTFSNSCEISDWLLSPSKRIATDNCLAIYCNTLVLLLCINKASRSYEIWEEQYNEHFLLSQQVVIEGTHSSPCKSLFWSSSWYRIWINIILVYINDLASSYN